MKQKLYDALCDCTDDEIEETLTEFFTRFPDTMDQALTALERKGIIASWEPME